MFGVNINLGEGIRKYLPALTIAFVAGILALVTLSLSPSPASATQDEEKVTICHRTASHTNPYTVNTVDKSSVDEVNNQYLNGHGDHTGPVWFPGIDGKWGDIIPPFESDSGTDFPGQNWSDAGRAIYRNGCVPTFDEEAVIVFDVVCAARAEDETVHVTFTNFGDTEGSAFLNGEEVVVPAGDTVIKFIELGTEVKIEINEKVVYQATPECEEPEEDGEVLGEDDQVVVPAGAVSAGGGGGSTDSVVATSLALVGSLAVAGFGVRKLRELS